MAYHLTKRLLCLGATALFCSAASAQAASQSARDAVQDCVVNAGITGTYSVQSVYTGRTESLRVLPGGGVSTRQSQQINACIAQQSQSTARPRVKIRTATRPTTIAGCLTLYRERLAATRGGRDYKGENVATRLVSGLFGRSIGRRLLENEHDRCLDNIASYANRCPTGVFSNGSGYCIKRPIW